LSWLKQQVAKVISVG